MPIETGNEPPYCALCGKLRTNLKAELEIASLHEKIDHLLHSQFARMVELQELQLDLLQELADGRARD